MVTLAEKNPNPQVKNSFQNDKEDSISLYLEQKKKAFLGWDSYVFSWRKISDSTLQELTEGTKNISIIMNIIQSVVDDMRFYSTEITVDVLRKVAKQLVTDFPQTFEDRNDDGTRFDNGYNLIFRRLRDRNFYLNRPHKRQSLQQKLKIPLNMRRIAMKVQSGCINWQPDVISPDENNLSVEERKNYLQHIDLHKVHTEDEIRMIVENLDMTYGSQRQYLNDISNVPKITEILTQWQILLQKEALFWHFQKLTGHTVRECSHRFTQNLHKLYVFGKLKMFFKEIGEGCTENVKNHDAMSVLPRIFKETMSTLIILHPVSFSIILFFNFSLHLFVIYIKKYT